jgi:hypothetical protein
VSESQTRTAYSQQQYDEGYPIGIDAHWWNSSRCRHIADQLKELNLTQARILEIGCGRGAVVKGLQEYGINAMGVELADVEPLVEVSSRVRTGTDAAALSQEERDATEVILLLDVIEHIENEQEFIENILQEFPSTHTLIITVPACSELWSDFDQYYGHFRRYDLQMLDSLIGEMGHTTLLNKYFFHFLYLPARCMSALGIQRGLILKPPQGRIQRLLHRFFAFIMWLDNRLISGAVKGSSAIAAVRIAKSPLHAK